MIAPNPIPQQRRQQMVYPQPYLPAGAAFYPPQLYGSAFPGFGPAPVMMPGAAAPSYPYNAYIGHSVTPMYVAMDASAATASNATPPSSVCGETAKLPRSGSHHSLSASSAGETASVVDSTITVSTQRTRPQHSVGTWGFALVDQLHPTLQRIPVPPSCLCEATIGIGLYDNDVTLSSTRPCKSSVCLLHSQGLGCAEGVRCRCFHVTLQYLQQCRSTMDSLCCAAHNCYYSQEMLSAGCVPHLSSRHYALSLDEDTMFPQDGEKPYLVQLSLLNVSLTVGLETLPCVNGVSIISWKKHVCHLNLSGKCKWTKDCGHIHVCRQLTKVLQNAETLDVLKALQATGVEKKAADLYREIILSEAALRFVRSSSALPLVTAFIENRDVEALKALARAKCALLPTQSAALQQMGVILPTTEAAPVAPTVDAKVQRLLTPRCC